MRRGKRRWEGEEGEKGEKRRGGKGEWGGEKKKERRGDI